MPSKTYMAEQPAEVDAADDLQRHGTGEDGIEETGAGSNGDTGKDQADGEPLASRDAGSASSGEAVVKELG